MKESGFFWHEYHDGLFGWCHSYEERATCIRTKKPKDERETRFRLFKPVKGNLPQEVIEARQAHVKAWRAFHKVCDETELVFREAERVFREAERVFREAGRVYSEAVRKNMPAIEALHEAECPDCPWNGQTIFPNA